MRENSLYFSLIISGEFDSLRAVRIRLSHPPASPRFSRSLLMNENSAHVRPLIPPKGTGDDHVPS